MPEPGELVPALDGDPLDAVGGYDRLGGSRAKVFGSLILESGAAGNPGRFVAAIAHQAGGLVESVDAGKLGLGLIYA